MTGEQQNPEAESRPAFGEILINPQAGSPKDEETKPVSSPRPTKRPKRSQRKTKKPRKQTRSARQPQGFFKKRLLRCGIILLILPAVLLLTYLAAARYLLPYYIQEQLAKQYTQQLHRPVTITQVDFAPFTFDLH
ncbi:MAG: hypothetical protein D3910_02740, partial [Candidatus Electrothrix sp. ATG2]|nr:hypothetical protein [Candidatus Electrothrix sp. ATG2]